MLVSHSRNDRLDRSPLRDPLKWTRSRKTVFLEDVFFIKSIKYKMKEKGKGVKRVGAGWGGGVGVEVG